MLRKLRPEIIIAKLDGGLTAFSHREVLEDRTVGNLNLSGVLLVVFRPITSAPKIFIFDQNNCLINDKIFQLEYYKRIVEIGASMFSARERKNFITSVKLYGTDECLSSEYNGFFPEDGAVCSFHVDKNGRAVVDEIVFPNGTTITDQQVIEEYIKRRSAPVPFLGKYDQNSLFWLLTRRGIDERQFRKISARAYKEIIAKKQLILPGFNELLSDFFERFNHKKSIMMVATDNALEIANASLERMGLHTEIQAVFARVDKIHNYPTLIRYIIDKYHVDPDEIVIFGDSYWSDIHPIIQSEFNTITTIHITDGKDYSRIYLKYGAPSIAAKTLDEAFRYMLETIPER